MSFILCNQFSFNTIYEYLVVKIVIAYEKYQVKWLLLCGEVGLSYLLSLLMYFDLYFVQPGCLFAHFTILRSLPEAFACRWIHFFGDSNLLMFLSRGVYN